MISYIFTIDKKVCILKICKPCGYVRDIPQHSTISFRKSIINANKMHTYEQITCNIHIKCCCIDAINIFKNPGAISSSLTQIDESMLGSVSTIVIQCILYLCFQNYKFTPQCNPIFHTNLLIHTSVLLSMAIRGISTVKKPGHFVVLDITSLLDIFTRVLILGDGKQIRVQFCCETFLLIVLRLLLALKQTLTIINFAFP